MPPKKDKAKKMALADFFADTTSGSWADDMVDVPTAPAARDPSLGPARGEAGYLDSMPDRGARSDRPSFPGAPLRDEVPVPTVPPFTAHVGNLTYEADEEALRQFFGPAEPSSVRIAKDIQSGQSKGYAHVDFPSADKLREALKMNGEQMQGRGIRISVAEPPANRKDYLPSAAEESSQWRRAGPLPAREAPAPRRGSSFAEPGPDRDWGAARGAKFVPAPPATGLGIRRESSGAGRMRDLPPSVADDAGQWRSARPLVEARGPANGGASGNSTPSMQGTPNLADTESTWSRGAKFRASQDPAPRHPVDSPNDDRDWRAARVPSVSTPTSDTAEDAPKAPAERRKLALAPRSSQPAAATSSENAEPKSPQANIFGAAKPIDTAAREAEVDKRMKEKEVERRKAAQAAKEEALRKEKEEDEKARQFAEERARAIQAVLNPGAAPAAPSGAPTGPKGQPGANRTPSGGIRGGRGSQRGGVRPQPPRNGPRSPNPNRPTNGEDGFAVAQGPGVVRPARNAQAPVEKKKDQPKQFSFAAAAALVDSDLVDDDDGEEEEEEAGESAETPSADVAEVQKGVEEIKV